MATKEQIEENKRKQELLRSAGYTNIKVDGSWGPYQERLYRSLREQKIDTSRRASDAVAVPLTTTRVGTGFSAGPAGVLAALAGPLTNPEVRHNLNLMYDLGKANIVRAWNNVFPKEVGEPKPYRSPQVVDVTIPHAPEYVYNPALDQLSPENLIQIFGGYDMASKKKKGSREEGNQAPATEPQATPSDKPTTASGTATPPAPEPPKEDNDSTPQSKFGYLKPFSGYTKGAYLGNTARGVRDVIYTSGGAGAVGGALGFLVDTAHNLDYSEEYPNYEWQYPYMKKLSAPLWGVPRAIWEGTKSDYKLPSNDARPEQTPEKQDSVPNNQSPFPARDITLEEYYHIVDSLKNARQNGNTNR